MEKLTMCSDAECQEHEKIYGGFNDFPPHWKRISQKEFAQSKFFSYDPNLTEHRQMYEKGSCPTGKMTAAVLFFFYDGTGIGMVRDFWKGTVRYYSFAKCEHKFEELSAREAREKGHDHYGMFCHVYECKKCGFVESHDSSG